jgi:hypothetical protein
MRENSIADRDGLNGALDRAYATPIGASTGYKRFPAKAQRRKGDTTQEYMLVTSFCVFAPLRDNFSKPSPSRQCVPNARADDVDRKQNVDEDR